MRLLDRYLFRELLIWTGFCLGGLMIVYIAFDLIGSLNNFQEHSLRISDVAELYLVKLPDMFVFILPIVLLLALLYTLTNFARHHELTAMRAAGISLWRICLPYFVLGFVLSVVVFALNEFCVPDSKARQAAIMDRHRHTDVDPAIHYNLFFINGRDDRKWQIGAFNSDTGVLMSPQVWWHENGTNYHLLAERAERVDGVWTFYGSSTFTTNDISNLDSLAAKLKVPTNNLAEYLSTNLSPATKASLARHTNGPDAELQRGLAADLNRLLRRRSFYSEKTFAGVPLSSTATNWLEENPHGIYRTQFDHFILAEAFPHEISALSLYSVNVTRGENDIKFQTNRFTLPQFSESPQDFANEIKFNSRFNNKYATDPGDVPIIELRHYIMMHPNLSTNRRDSLETQMHGRFAEPWKCLVVVLIAIPFGAASGRRNIFMGVAGSIVICFAYFILLKLALALGTGGYLPPWLAAWLPNVFFGVAGFWLTLRVR